MLLYNIYTVLYVLPVQYLLHSICLLYNIYCTVPASCTTSSVLYLLPVQNLLHSTGFLYNIYCTVPASCTISSVLYMTFLEYLLYCTCSFLYNIYCTVLASCTISTVLYLLCFLYAELPSFWHQELELYSSQYSSQSAGKELWNKKTIFNKFVTFQDSRY